MLSLVVALLLAAQAAASTPTDAPPPTPEPAAANAAPLTARPTAPLTAAQAVDANGVPAWAKRKHMQAVQNCESLPRMGVETWRQNYDPKNAAGLRPRPPQTTCRR